MAPRKERAKPATVAVFSAYAPCPECGEAYPHHAPKNADKSHGVAYPALLDHYARQHPDATPPSPPWEKPSSPATATE